MPEPLRRGRGSGTRNDPGRRERILDATARIIVRDGIDAVSFRGVAQEAGVPLGSTTYYFADKDALLLEAIALNRDKGTGIFEAVLREEVGRLGVVDGLARVVEVWTIEQRDGFLFDYTIYLGAFHNGVLRAEATKWQMVDAFESVFDDELAAPLAYLVDGMLLRAMMTGARITAAEAAPLIAGLVAGLTVPEPASR